MSEDVIAGRYRLEERLGHGAMSEVWAATDTELERRIAIKLLGRDADPARFEREARAAAALSHPNICGLYDYGTAEHGRPFMALECVGGGSLDDRLRYGTPLPDDETRAIAAGVAAGLAHAHARGLVHRDLKPGNILFDSEGRPKIADLGIARMSGAGTLTEAGTVLGTAAYISPEQARGEPATPASDVYSFGVILYRMLTGRLPFEAEDPMALVALHANQEAPPIAERRPDAPAVLESVATAALAKDPAQRPPDGAALLAELDPSVAQPTVLAPPPTEATAVAQPPPPASRRLRAAAIVTGALLLATAGIAAAFIASGTASSDAEPTPALSVSVPKRPAAEPPPPVVDDTEPATTEPTTSEKRTTTKKANTQPAPPPPPPPTTERTPTDTETIPTDTETIPPPPPPPEPTTTETTPATTAPPAE